jgi:hypothetical protein
VGHNKHGTSAKFERKEKGVNTKSKRFIQAEAILIDDSTDLPTTGLLAEELRNWVLVDERLPRTWDNRTSGHPLIRPRP